MTPLAFRPKPALGSPPGLATHENQPPCLLQWDPGPPGPAHGASPLSTERALPSAPALARLWTSARPRPRCLRRRRGGPSVRAQPRGIGACGVPERVRPGWPRTPRGRGRRGGRETLGSGCVRLGSPRRGLCGGARWGADAGPCLEESSPPLT